jgi:hypothetical protein
MTQLGHKWPILLRCTAPDPLANLIAVVYVIGAVTGGSLFALLRRSYKGWQRDRSL